VILADVTDVLTAARLPLARTSPEGLRVTWDGDRIRVAYIAEPAPGLHIREDLAFGRAAAALRGRGWHVDRVPGALLVTDKAATPPAATPPVPPGRPGQDVRPGPFPAAGEQP
jgi:hypothetical protein